MSKCVWLLGFACVNVSLCFCVCRQWEDATAYRGRGHEACGRENSGQTAGQDALWQGRIYHGRHLYCLNGTVSVSVCELIISLTCLADPFNPQSQITYPKPTTP